MIIITNNTKYNIIINTKTINSISAITFLVFSLDLKVKIHMNYNFIVDNKLREIIPSKSVVKIKTTTNYSFVFTTNEDLKPKKSKEYVIVIDKYGYYSLKSYHSVDWLESMENDSILTKKTNLTNKNEIEKFLKEDFISKQLYCNIGYEYDYKYADFSNVIFWLEKWSTNDLLKLKVKNNSCEFFNCWKSKEFYDDLLKFNPNKLDCWKINGTWDIPIIIIEKNVSPLEIKYKYQLFEGYHRLSCLHYLFKYRQKDINLKNNHYVWIIKATK